MKRYIAILSTVIMAGLFLVSCDKVADLPNYNNGTTPVLSASTTTIAPQATDSNKVALVLNWSNPNYAADSTKYKYIIEIDSTGKNFRNADTLMVSGKRYDSIPAKRLNKILLDRGYAFNVPVDMDVRLISSYPNNNERLTSNTIKVRMTPYKVPPKVALPTSGKLFIVGSATQGDWSNPVPTPAQEFTRLDETTFAGVFQLNGGKEYLLLPVNGDWGSKYAITDAGIPGINQGGDFQFYTSGGSNIPSPATSGWYKIVVDFQMGKFIVTPYTSTLPTNLFIVGDATPGGWNNPVPVPSQQFTRVNSSVWEITLPLTGGKEYLILPNNGDWSKKYAVKDNSIPGIASGGEFGYHQDGQPAPDIFTSNFKGPATTGTYKITLNFAAPTTTAGASGRFTVQ